MVEIKNLADKIIGGYNISKEEALNLYKCNVNELSSEANRIRMRLCSEYFDLCTIINGKSGRCSEDCKYCSQSAYHNTESPIYPMLSQKEIVTNALKSHQDGINRFSIVTSGKKLSKNEVDYVCKVYEKIKSLCSINLCSSHGLLEYEDFVKLKKSGVTRYHNNLETSKNYFSEICTTHTYEEKVQAIKDAQRAGLIVCSGGIFGLGESLEDRIDMAFELKNLEITSVPINILNPIKGTLLENNRVLDDVEIIKSIAIYRFILRDADLRLAGGRILLKDNGLNAVSSGINSAITGNMLTTLGSTVKEDINMVTSEGFKVGYYV
ncbi:MAG: biotin synthase BioB [Clostridium sp.]